MTKETPGEFPVVERDETLRAMPAPGRSAAELLNIAIEAFGGDLKNISWYEAPAIVTFEWRGHTWKVNQSLGVEVKLVRTQNFVTDISCQVAERLLRVVAEKMRI